MYTLRGECVNMNMEDRHFIQKRDVVTSSERVIYQLKSDGISLFGGEIQISGILWN